MSLSGVRVAVTRARAQAAEIAEPLRAAGADVLLCPLIRIEPCEIDALPEADWIVFTSVNGVECFMNAVEARGVNLERSRFACVGPATTERLQRYGFRAEVVPAVHTGEAVAAAMAAHTDLSGKKVLLARAVNSGQALPRALRESGAEVYDLELYRSVLDEDGAKNLKDAISDGKIHLITFTSGSSIRYFVETAGTSHDLIIAVIGPSTAEVAEKHGLRVDIQADPHTTAGLVQAIEKFYGGMNAGT